MKQNLHTHTEFCDGRSKAEEILEVAISRGFDSIGFSAHAPTSADNSSMFHDAEAYYNEIMRLKEKYRDRIKVYFGTELDRFSEGLIPNLDFDYKIGSTHSARVGDSFIHFDYTLEHSLYAINELFGGDERKFVRAYYNTLAEMPERMSFDIVGHFDLLSKFKEQYKLFDAESDWYRSLAFEALHSLRERCEIFEVNTGAIARGFRTTPYPDGFILDEMRRLDCKLIISSDCHEKSKIDCSFDLAREYVKAHGFGEIYFLTDRGFVGEKI